MPQMQNCDINSSSVFDKITCVPLIDDQSPSKIPGHGKDKDKKFGTYTVKR